jgi:hypothetical protein
MTYLAGFIVVAVKVSSILIGCVWPAPANRSWCRPGRGGVGKTRDPAGVYTPLQWQGGRGGRSRIFLSPWVIYDLPSQFTCPQELARNTVKHLSNDSPSMEKHPGDKYIGKSPGTAKKLWHPFRHVYWVLVRRVCLINKKQKQGLYEP